MTPKKVRKFLLALAEEWSPLFGLDDWDVQYEWHEGPIPDEHPDALAVTRANWSYKHATIQVSLSNCRDRSKDYLERVFFHEVGHILCRVLPLPTKKGRVTSEEERFCTDLSQIVQRIGRHCYDKGVQDGKAEAIRTEPRDYQPSDIGGQVA